MPLVRIDLPKTMTARRRDVVADVVHQTLADVLAVPADDRFQIISHGTTQLRINEHYLGIERSPGASAIESETPP